MVVLFVILVGIAALIYWKVQGPMQQIEFVSVSSATWYQQHGNALTPISPQPSDAVIQGPSGETATAMLVPALPTRATGKAGSTVTASTPAKFVWALSFTDTKGRIHILGLGRPLGFLPDGSLLALGPLGVERVSTTDGSAEQLIAAGGSATPFGAAAADLSVIAFQNETTQAVTLYHFNPQTLAGTYLGIVALPATKVTSAPPTAEVQQRAWLECHWQDRSNEEADCSANRAI